MFAAPTILILLSTDSPWAVVVSTTAIPVVKLYTKDETLIDCPVKYKWAFAVRVDPTESEVLVTEEAELTITFLSFPVPIPVIRYRSLYPA